MKVNLKNLSDNKFKATFELNSEDLEKYIEKAEDVLAKDAELKGFRRGKAPKEAIRKHFGREKVRSLALEMAIEGSLSDEIENRSLDVSGTRDLSIEKNISTELVYSVVLDLFPEIKLVDLSAVKAERKTVNVDDKEVGETLETIKNSRASFVDKKESETVENGDRVEVDFEVKENGKIIEGGISNNHPLVVGGRSFMPGFEEQIVGMKKNETKLFSLVAPRDYLYKEVAGKKLDFQVTVKSVKKVIAAEINDNFAKSLGRFTSLDELKQNIRDGLTIEKSAKEKQRLRLEIIDGIIARSSIEVPKDMVDSQIDMMLSEFDRDLHEKGLELSLYLMKIGKSQSELRKESTKQAERQVKMSLILRKIVKNFKLKASDEEVQAAVSQAVQAAMARGELNQSEVDLAKVKETLVVRIENEKALEYIEARCAV